MHPVNKRHTNELVVNALPVNRPYRSSIGWLAWMIVATLAVGNCGCVNYIANIMKALGKDKTPAEYAGFKGKKVAIVCGNEKGLSNDATATLLARALEVKLNRNVKEISIVRQDKVDRWLDEQGGKSTDIVEIGKGVGAEQVLSITLANVSLRDGSTLFKGRADISVTVYDIENDGRVVYRKNLPEFEYPKMDGPTITDTTEAKFRVVFLDVVSRNIAPLFYPFDQKELFALDAAYNSL